MALFLTIAAWVLRAAVLGLIWWLWRVFSTNRDKMVGELLPQVNKQLNWGIGMLTALVLVEIARVLVP